jgi:hypothetical protein
VKVADARRMLKDAGGLKGLEEALGRPLGSFHHDCHNASLRVVKTGIFGPARVARGMSRGTGISQHSWIVVGEVPPYSERPDPWDADAVVADPTMWSYQDAEPYVHFGKNTLKTHVPHGTGSIWAFGHPGNCAPGETAALEWKKPPSKAALVFMDFLGPLSREGWINLAHYPVQGWPSGEIIGAIADTFGEAHVPIDILGMTTERNPGGLYW